MEEEHDLNEDILSCVVIMSYGGYYDAYPVWSSCHIRGINALSNIWSSSSCSCILVFSQKKKKPQSISMVLLRLFLFIYRGW